MKRIITSLSLAAVLAMSLAGGAMAQTEGDTGSDAATITVVVTFDDPVLAGYSAGITSGEGAVSAVEGDTTLRITLPATADPMTPIEVALTADSASVARVSANDATFDELVAALDGAGVTPADRWAREVMEYRPYDPDDPTLGQLQDELTKYDPSAETLAAILSVLEP